MKHKVHSAINVFGLAIGLTAFILISLFVEYEYSWDKHNFNYERIYRVQRKYENVRNTINGNDISPHTRGLTAKLLEEQFPEFEKVLLVQEISGKFLSSSPDNSFYDEQGCWSENSIFDVFTYHFIEGRKEHALSDPFSVVLSKTMADKLFPNESAFGKTILIDKKFGFKVTGVYMDLPSNSHLRPSFIVSSAFDENTNNIRNSWSGFYRTYVLMKNGADDKAINKKVSNLFKEYKSIEFEKIQLCPLSKIHLGFNDRNDYLFVLFLYRLIGIFVLLLASINYINFTTANTSLRAREIAVRKVHGSNRISLINQFLGETIIITLIALSFAFVLSELLLPVFNRVIDVHLLLSYTKNGLFIQQIVLIAVLVGLLSGVYPAFFMTSFKTIDLFKGNLITQKREKFSLKKMLVTFQFTISILMILLTLIVTVQIKYMMNKDLGFNKENILFAKFGVSKKDVNFEELRNRILKHPEIVDASLSRHIPFISEGGQEYNWEGSSVDEKINVRDNYVSYDFIENFGIQMIMGRDFSRDYPSDIGRACIINETAAKYFGWDNPIGKRINDNRFQVIGVVKDYHSKDMHNKIEANVMLLQSGPVLGDWTFAFRIHQNDLSRAKEILTKEFETCFPNDPFEFRLLSYEFQHESTFKIYQTVNSTFLFFAIVNIMLAVFGLLGLVSFIIQRRTKEIGIRKINGCTSGNIFLLLSKEYLVVLIIASIIGWLGGYIVYQYFPGSYKYPLQLWEFISASLIILVIAIMASGFQTIKVSFTNPANALRYE
jgi:putative ABC transport system permease protein